MDLPVWLSLALTVLAAHRVTWLITDDVITEPLRERAAAGPRWLGVLVTCPWCVGFWVSLAAVLGWWLTRDTGAVDWWTVGTGVLACSTVVGLLSSWTPR